MGHLSLGKQTQFGLRLAVIMMQGWFGFPYIYVLTLGILQSIPNNDLYEAAYMMVQTFGKKLRNITFPNDLKLLRDLL